MRKPAVNRRKVAAKPRARRASRPKSAKLRLKSIQNKLTPVLSRWLMGASALLFLVGASLWGYLWLSSPDNLKIREVNIQGAMQHITKGELDEKLAPLVDTNLFLLDKAALVKQLEAEPWIRGGNLRKIWPWRLDIQITEEVPIAFWGKKHLLNQYGEIFEGEMPDKQGVFPFLHSPKDNGREMGERYVYLQRLLNNTSLEIVELIEDEAGIWHIRFRQGPKVILGRKEHDKRIKRFKVGYLQGLKDNFSLIRQIDLRYTNGFAIEWKQTPRVL